MKKLIIIISVLVLGIVAAIPIVTKAVDVNKAYNVGTSYVALTPAIMVEDNGLKLSANTRPNTNNVKLNISQDGVSVATGTFPVQVARVPITATMYPRKIYKVHVRATSGTATGTVHYYTSK